ncbi:hypothetical protein ACRRTK_007440 [Alexandromys fortis]
MALQCSLLSAGKWALGGLDSSLLPSRPALVAFSSKVHPAPTLYPTTGQTAVNAGLGAFSISEDHPPKLHLSCHLLKSHLCSTLSNGGGCVMTHWLVL